MAVLTLDLYSYELAMNTSAAVILPERRGVPHEPREGAYPVLYLLHGHGQDYTSWIRMSRIEGYAQNLDLIVVMPDGGRGCYVDGVSSHRYGSYLTQELPVALGNWFRVSPRREDTFIAGMSMGGYGALRAAFAFPEKYGAVCALSTAFRLRADRLRGHGEQGLNIPDFPEIEGNFTNIFGSEKDYSGSRFDLETLARKACGRGVPLPRVLQLCGDRDPLAEENRAFAAFMERECPELPHVYKERPGIHDFDFWDGQIVDMLEFFGLA